MHTGNQEGLEGSGDELHALGRAPTAAVAGTAVNGKPAAIVTNSPSSPNQGGALQHALLSAFIPGAAQLTQGRWVAAITQCGVVVAYLAGVFAVGPKQAIWLALFWNAYSALEAYWYARD